MQLATIPFWFSIQHSCTSNRADQIICFRVIVLSLQASEIPNNCVMLCYDDELLCVFLPCQLALLCIPHPARALR